MMIWLGGLKALQCPCSPAASRAQGGEVIGREIRLTGVEVKTGGDEGRCHLRLRDAVTVEAC